MGTNLSTSQMAEVMAAAKEMLAQEDSEKKNKKIKGLQFLREGTKIVIPEKLSLTDARTAIDMKINEENQKVSVHEEVDCFPLDGANALMQVLEARYGFVTAVGTPGMFGDRPPVMVNLEIGYQKNTQVIWGSFEIPNIKGRFQTGANFSGKRPKFVIGGETTKRFEKEIREMAEDVRTFVRTNSVYKGQAIRLRTDDEGNLSMENPPSFLDVESVNEEELVLPTIVETQVRTSVFTPIEYTEGCRRYKIPLKRGVLLAGPYGTGKTLCAYVTAKKCIQNKWTFIYLDRVTGLDQALNFARLYSPAVVFAEDLDRVTSGEERTVDIDDVLNTIDGIESKNTEIMTVLTTNHVEKINRAMLRPGRLDSVITFTAPDAKAAEKLLRIYGRGILPTKENLEAAGRLLEGKIPAVIREVVERSKLYAINRTAGKEAELGATDIENAAVEMGSHLELLNPKPIEVLTDGQKIANAFEAVVKRAVGTNGSGSLYERVEKVETAILEKFE